MFKMLGKRIYIWGTGNKAEVFCKKYKIFVCIDTPYRKIWDENILGFIDVNGSKQGSLFYEKKIVSPQQAVSEGMNFCIIAVVKHADIVRTLKEYGYEQSQYVYLDEFLRMCRDFALKHSAEYLAQLGKTLPENFAVAVDIIRRIRNSNKVNEFCNHMLFYELLNRSNLQDTGCFSIEKIKEVFSLPEIVANLAWIYGNEIEGLSAHYEKCSLIHNKKNTVKTIGIYVGRFYGGGIEKVLSLLIPLYIGKGYRVILLTDSYDGSKEYALPSMVVRYVFKHSYDDDLKARLQELECCIKTNEIDIMCFHFGYERISTFYEMLFVRLLGIPTIIEIHSAHKALLEDHKKIANKLCFIYRMANKVVTLSSADRRYWETKGCQCVVIPNPVENFGLMQIPGRNNEKDEQCILWVGRIVERPKRVTDAVKIMRKVADRVTNVRLNIVGSLDNMSEYDHLCNTIKQMSLENEVEILHYREDMKELYFKSDVVLITSESESFSNVLMEGRMFARPVVMYEIPWLFAEKQPQGVIAVTQGNIDDAANAIVRLLNNEEEWNRYSIDGWNAMKEHATYNVMDDWERLFREIL